MSKQKDRPYRLEPYNPDWKAQFTAVAEEIAPIYGDNLITLEHIGSTSIDCADMWAKPNIDVLVVVQDIDQMPAIYEQMRNTGYTPQGREYVGNGDEYFTKDDPYDGRRLVSVHTYEQGNPQIRKYRTFRDYLKNNQTDRTAYVTLKKQLYAAHQNEYAAYDAGKSDLIEVIKTRAIQWAAQHLPKNEEGV